MTSENRNILLGTFVLLFGTLCLVISSRGGIESSVDGYKLHALFQNIDGVTIGTDVVLSGVKIGKVTSQTYVPDGHRALVTMHIRNDIPLPIDSVVLVLSSGMLGGKYLKLEPGGEVDTLEPGDVLEYAQGAIIFEDLLQKIVLNAETRRLNLKAKKIVPPHMNRKVNPFGSLLK